MQHGSRTRKCLPCSPHIAASHCAGALHAAAVAGLPAGEDGCRHAAAHSKAEGPVVCFGGRLRLAHSRELARQHSGFPACSFAGWCRLRGRGVLARLYSRRCACLHSRHPCFATSPAGCPTCSLCLQRLRTTYSLDSPAVQAATHAAVTAAMEASNGVAAMAAMGAAPGSSRRPARAAAAGAAAAARAAAEAAGTPVARRASGGLGRTSSSGGAPLSLLPMSPEDDGAVVTPGVAPQVMFGGCATATLLLVIGCTPAVCRAPLCLASCSLHAYWPA